jgi:hypothetical protein
MATLGWDEFGSAVAGLTALSTASFGLLDATKAFGGGISNFGTGPLKATLVDFEPALAAALGANWWVVVRASWIGGVPKADQKAKVQALIKLGLNSSTAPRIAPAAHVDAAALTAAVTKLETGAALDDADLNVIGRMNATIDALMDAGFEAADARYRNWSRALAGLVSMLLALVAWYFIPEGAGKPSLALSVIVGLLAVPIAPVAKDLTSALSTAMQALKAAKRV